MRYRDSRAAEARRLRVEEGLSSKEIQQRLGVEKNRLQYWLAGLPTSEGQRPQARDDLKARARALRYQGKTYDEIVAALGVSQSSVSLWVRDIPVVEPEVPRGWTTEARQRRARRQEAKREFKRDNRKKLQVAHRTRLEPYSYRDLEIAAAMAYWCEGSKVKPWGRQSGSVSIINMDPSLIRLFLKFLQVVPVAHGGPSFRIHLHESADEQSAKEYWSGELGIAMNEFLKTSWKRHNPATVRKNVNEDYHGCIIVQVRRSSALYWHLEDLAKAILGGICDDPYRIIGLRGSEPDSS